MLKRQKRLKTWRARGLLYSKHLGALKRISHQESLIVECSSLSLALFDCLGYVGD